MGIGPITNLMPLPVARSMQGDLDPLPMERVESSAKTGDEKYSASGGKSARDNEDNGPDEDALQQEFLALEDETGTDGLGSSSVQAKPRTISFFA
jgi:hypothetical protein